MAGAEAALLSYPACATFDTLWTVLVHGRAAFHIVWWREQGKAAIDRPLYDQMLATFSFR